MSALVIGGKPVKFGLAQVSMALSSASEAIRVGLRKHTSTAYDWYLTCERTCLGSANAGQDYNPFESVDIGGDPTPCVLVVLGLSPRLEREQREMIAGLVDSWCASMVRSSHMRASGEVQTEGVEEVGDGPDRETVYGNRVRFWWPLEEGL